MKNREKFREQILEWAVAPGRDICDFKRKEVLAHFGKEGCDGISCPWCAILLDLWLDEEYKEPSKVDWDKVPVDTLVRVRDGEYEKWRLRYFSGFFEYDSLKYATWNSGRTSKTAEGTDDFTTWRYCELVEEEEDGSN